MSVPVQMTLVTLEPPLTVDTTVSATRQSSAEVRRTAPSSLQSMEQEGETTVICQRTKLSKSPVFRPKIAKDGSWSAWTAWRECVSGENCVYTRTRACDDPAPLLGGRECAGEAQYKGHKENVRRNCDQFEFQAGPRQYLCLGEITAILQIFYMLMEQVGALRHL